MAKNKNIWIQRKVLNSKAFCSLSSGAMLVYLHFLMKRQMGKTSNKKDSWIIKNNGELVFTYVMAKKELGMYPSRFMRSIDKLIENGLLDIPHTGSGSRKGDYNLYAISDRWELFGKDNFVKKTRPKDTRKIGFRHNKQHIKTRVSKQ